MTIPFTLDGYDRLLHELLARDYLVRDFHDADPAARHLILRHDIDMSVDAARIMAEREAELGVRAVYFVLLRSELYNAWSEAAAAGLDAIAAAGHEIGLHFDASLYGEEADALDQAAAAECAVLETINGEPVRTISFHRPAPALQARAGAIAGRRHAYEPRFFTEMGYCSDSRGGWHHGAPLDNPAVANGTALQLLTHPVWWVGDATPPEDRLTSVLDGRLRALDQAMADNCTVHRPGRILSPESE